MEKCIKKINLFKKCFKFTIFLILFIDLFYCYYKGWNILEDIPGIICFSLCIICTIPFYFFMFKLVPFPRGNLLTMIPLLYLKANLVFYIAFLAPFILLFNYIKYKKLLRTVDIEN